MYGVIIITVLMGSGLISLPKRLWQLSHPHIELHCLYITVSKHYNIVNTYIYIVLQLL